MNCTFNRSANCSLLMYCLLAGLLSLLSACSTNVAPAREGVRSTNPELRPRQAASAPRVESNEQPPIGRRPSALSGSGSERGMMLLGNDKTYAEPSPQEAEKSGESGITLNVENGDIREIVRNLLGDAMGESFVIDPAVTGTVTVRTIKGISRSQVVPTLEMLLRSVKATLIKDGNYWRVLPEAAVNLGTVAPRAQIGNGTGHSIVILPIKHIGAKEMERLLLPFAKTTTPAAIRVDELRNLLFVTGTESELRNLLAIAEMFDVNMLAGMSFLLHPLESADVKAVAADWEKIFPAATNPYAGLLRVIPIERMNAILLVSPRKEVVIEARQWIERLDKGGDAGGGARLYVYYVQYTQVEKLQATLQQAISGRVNAIPQAAVAPGQNQSVLVAPVSPIAGQPIVTPGNTFVNGALPATTSTQNQTIQRPIFSGAQGNNQVSALARNATVIADKDRNALLIVATPTEYSAIEAAIKKLDTPPKMVAIEVQIAQVALTGDLSFGIAGLFAGKPNSPLNRLTSADGRGALNLNLDGTSPTTPNGFNYTWQGAAAKVILSTLQDKGQSRTIASPTLITLDNQKVSFTNGTQISVQTQSTVASGTTSATNSYQYINTGLTINITPRVSGDNVFLEIQQQNSNAQPRNDGNPNPNITQNSQQTSVMVANGDTMLLGGLFLDSSSSGSSGLPGLSTVPVLGGLFGTQNWKSTRSELVMLVTPRIMSSVEEARSIVDELRGKLKNLESLVPEASTVGLPTSRDAAREKPSLNGDAKLNVFGEFSRSLRIPNSGGAQ